MVLSDQNATDFTTRTTVPIFRDASAGRTAWQATQPGATKHDTFVYARTGERTFYWDASATQLSSFAAEIRAAVEAQGK